MLASSSSKLFQNADGSNEQNTQEMADRILSFARGISKSYSYSATIKIAKLYIIKLSRGSA